MEPRKGGKHIPDVLTYLRREKQFSPKDKHSIPRETVVEMRMRSKEGKKGTNVIIYERLLKSLPRIEKKWARERKSREDTLTAKALMLSRLACDYADHGVKGLRMNGLLGDKGILKGMRTTPDDPNKEKRAWEYYYNGMIERFSKDTRVSDREEIHDRMVEIDRFSGMPEKIHTMRSRHSRELGKIVGRIIGQNQDPQKNLAAEVQRVLKRPTMDYPGSRKAKPMALRALDVCLAVSVYADIMERTQKKEWPTAYTEGMLSIYPLLRDKPALIRAIAEIE